jgi:hypothetical protein
MTVLRSVRALGALLALAAGTAPLASVDAQSLSSQTSRLQPDIGVGPGRIISTNPLLPLFGNFAAEYEHRVRANVAVAVSGSHYDFDEDRLTHLDAKVRLYPNDRAMEGFGMATSLGMAWLRTDEDNIICDGPPDFNCTNTGKRTSFSTPTFAVELGYQWLLGRSRSTAVTVGIGAKRYLGGSDDEFNGLSRVLPTGRLSIGYGF